MKQVLIYTILLSLFGSTISAQQFIAEKGQMTITVMDDNSDIEVINNNAFARLYQKTGILKILLSMGEFENANDTIQQLDSTFFNPQYFPLLSIKGLLTNPKKILLSFLGSQTIEFEGKIRFRGKEIDIISNADLKGDGNSLGFVMKLDIPAKDFDIDSDANIKLTLLLSFRPSVNNPE